LVPFNHFGPTKSLLFGWGFSQDLRINHGVLLRHWGIWSVAELRANRATENLIFDIVKKDLCNILSKNNQDTQKMEIFSTAGMHILIHRNGTNLE
jgi:hypothetical protein